MNPPPLSSPPAKPSSGGYWLYSGIVLITFLLVLMTACVITYVMPKKYESKAVVHVKGYYSAREELTMTTVSFPSENEIFRSQQIVKMVIERLNLTTQWNMSEEEALTFLREIIDVQNIRGTDLVAIKVKHTHPEQARDIAKEVFLSYKKRREDKEREIMADSLKELKQAIVDQADVVEEKRKQRDNLVTRSNGNANDPTLLEVQKEFETQKVLLDKMKENLVIEQINAKPGTGQLELHEEPLLPQYPVSPNVNLNLILGATLGLLFGLLMALFVRSVFGRRISG